SQEKYNTKEKRAETKELYIRHQDLEGDLNLSDFVNLEKLDCSHNQITHLEITDCTNLKKLDCSNNQLTNLDLTNNKKLEILDIRINNFSKKQDLTFLSHLVNLEIGQGTCNYFTGSLEFLKNLNKLKKLDIDGTDIDSGLEYLPNSIEKFYCAPRKREEAKVRTIHIFFADEQGIVREEGDGYIVNFPRKLQDFKKWQEKGFTNEQRKEAGLKLEEWTFADYIKEKGCDISNTDKIEELIKEYRQAQT
ncbi:26187_t:CDS:2, partial [Racocetra persica]